MSNPTMPHSYSSIAISLVPKLTALIFMALWLTGAANASAGKLGLAFGMLALFDAVTLASLRKGSVKVEWPDISLIIGGLVGPMVLPLYATAVIGVIALGGNDEPAAKRMLGGTAVERLASATPSRFTAPGHSNTSTATANPTFINGPSMSPGQRPMPPGMQARPTTQMPNGYNGATSISTNGMPRPTTGNPPRPTSSPSASAPTFKATTTPPSSSSPPVVKPAPAPTASPSPAPPAAPTQSAKP